MLRCALTSIFLLPPLATLMHNLSAKVLSHTLLMQWDCIWCRGVECYTSG